MSEKPTYGRGCRDWLRWQATRPRQQTPHCKGAAAAATNRKRWRLTVLLATLTLGPRLKRHPGARRTTKSAASGACSAARPHGSRSSTSSSLNLRSSRLWTMTQPRPACQSCSGSCLLWSSCSHGRSEIFCSRLFLWLATHTRRGGGGGGSSADFAVLHLLSRHTHYHSFYGLFHSTSCLSIVTETQLLPSWTQA